MTARTLTRRDRLLLWAGVAGPAGAWAVHLIGSYGYEEAACATGTGADLVEPVVLGLAVVLGGLLVACGAGALVMYRAVTRGEIADPRGRVRFLALAGATSAIVFGFGIILQAAPIIALEPCAP